MKDAIRDFSNALNLTMKLEKIPYFNLILERGKCYRKLGKLEESVRDLTKVCKYNKIQGSRKLAIAFNELGRLLNKNPGQ